MLNSKWIALSLILLMFGLSAGCGSSTSQPSSTPQANQTTPLISTSQGPTALPSAELITSAKGFVDLLAKGDFESAVKGFDSTMAAILPPAKLGEAWTGLQTQFGSFKQQIGTRTGRLTDKGQQYDIVFVTCEFEKGVLDARVVFNSARQISGLQFMPSDRSSEYQSPSYVKPDSYNEKEVTVGSGEWVLSGTLSIPKGDGPFAAVVLVQGSGPNDRDETIGPNKPFRDLAGGLASQGIAVLRYEKRTKQYAAKLASQIDQLTVKEETVDDALAAVALLRKTEGIRQDRIFVLGHSLGGMLIPRIASQDSGIAGFVMMAGNSRPLEDVVLEQVTYLASLNGAASDADKAQLEEFKNAVTRVKDSNLTPSTPAKDLPLGIPAKYWLDLRGYDQKTLAQEIKQPMLIMQGERDYQVTTADFRGWQEALSNHPNVQFKLYPNLNHLFFDGTGKSTPTEYDKPGHVFDVAVADIGMWLKKQ